MIGDKSVARIIYHVIEIESEKSNCFGIKQIFVQNWTTKKITKISFLSQSQLTFYNRIDSE